MSLGRSQRSGVVVEPMLSTQWFVSMKPLAKPSLAAVENGFMRFVPKQWENTYFAWLRDIKTGVFLANCGGGIKFQPGTVPSVSMSRLAVMSRHAARRVVRRRSSRKPTFSTPGSRQRCGPFRCLDGRKRRTNSTDTIPQPY